MNRSAQEAAVRQMLERTPPPLPAELYPDVVRRGARRLRRRTLTLRVLWLLLFAATVAFVVWAAVVEPWVEPPSQTTPPLTGW
ncbi:hypothetical protein ABT300_23815 [Streptomyces sp. NPDC001027]|uniref:hypothetical protein n=1 Tax=Streptomyces sp. NPDC001027 TaxID=3154771 RepID=UPI003323D37F